MTVIPLGVGNLIMGLILNLVLCCVVNIVVCGKSCTHLLTFQSFKVWWDFSGNNETSHQGIISLPHYQYVHHPVEYSEIYLMFWWINRWESDFEELLHCSGQNTSMLHTLLFDSLFHQTYRTMIFVIKYSGADVSWHPPLFTSLYLQEAVKSRSAESQWSSAAVRASECAFGRLHSFSPSHHKLDTLSFPCIYAESPW